MKYSMSFCFLAKALLFTCATIAQDETTRKKVPPELQVIKESIGIWDCEIEVWPVGPNNDSVKFSGVDTVQAHGKHWMSSDFVSTFQGKDIVVHSIVGYDLDKKQLVGTVVDEGPYAARMEGTYDAKTKTVTWKTYGKMPNGEKLFQRTTIKHESNDLRILELSNPASEKGKFVKFMVIKYKRKKEKK